MGAPNWLAQPSTFTKTGEVFAEFEAQIDNTREGEGCIVVGGGVNKGKSEEGKVRNADC